MWLWHDHAALILGAVLGTTTAMLVTHVLRGLHIPRWVSLPVELVVLIAIVSNRAGGLIPLTGALERVGFTVGNTRFYLLRMLTLSVNVVELFAGIRRSDELRVGKEGVRSCRFRWWQDNRHKKHLPRQQSNETRRKI